MFAVNRGSGEDDGAEFDVFFDLLKNQGMAILKFGRRGNPHQKLLKITGNLKYIYWQSAQMSPKLGGLCYIDLERVVRISVGQSSLVFQRFGDKFAANKDTSLSLYYLDAVGNELTFDIIAPTAESFKTWCGALRWIVRRFKEQRSRMTIDELRLRDRWFEADIDHNGTLSRDECVEMVAHLNINMPPASVQSLFDIVDVDKNNELTFMEFTEFYSLLCKRPELEAMWKTLVRTTSAEVTAGQASNFEDVMSAVTYSLETKFANEKELGIAKDKDNHEATSIKPKSDYITIDAFIAFWDHFQAEILSRDEAVDLLVDCTHEKPEFFKDIVTYASWRKVLDSCDINGVFMPEKMKLYQDMGQPLSHYYIASSHNTYLEGDQLTSKSSVQRYISVLQLGCRCVEVDCWNGDNGLPIVTHGHTMTSSIPFQDVIAAIRDNAFAISPYPVIVSIENHCDLKQQQAMAKILREELGSILVPASTVTMPYLPSPEDLKYKVLLKGKRSPRTAHEISEDSDNEESDDDVVEDDEINDGGQSVDKVASTAVQKHTSTESLEAPAAKIVVKQKPHAKMPSKGQFTSEIHPELSALIFLGTMKLQHGFHNRDEIPVDIMVSVGETKVLTVLKKPSSVVEWASFNQRHFSRIYPRGLRVDSSNFDPVPAWATGCHMVALNYQTFDLGYQINAGKFLENGQCGYLLKPDYMLVGGQAGSGASSVRVTANAAAADLKLQKSPLRPTIKTSKTEIRASTLGRQDNRIASYTLIVHIVSGQQIPKPNASQRGEVVDPFVVVRINAPPPLPSQEERTKAVQDNGFNPIWNETLSFQVLNPNCAAITFSVYDEDPIMITAPQLLAFASFSASCIRPGLRTIPLQGPRGREGAYAYASLLVRITLEPISL